MAYGCFTVRGVPPTMEEARAAVGGCAGLWDRLMACAAERYRARPNFTFYGRNHGWALVFRKAGKALLGVFPDREAVTALVVLPVAEAALAARSTCRRPCWTSCAARRSSRTAAGCSCP